MDFHCFAWSSADKFFNQAGYLSSLVIIVLGITILRKSFMGEFLSGFHGFESENVTLIRMAFFILC